MLREIEAEIDKNFDVFLRNVSRYLPAKEGQYALLHNGHFVDFYGTPLEAERAGEQTYSDGIYSIQQVTLAPADLGFFSHAFDNGEA